MSSPTSVAQSALRLAGLSSVMVPTDWPNSDRIKGMEPRLFSQP
jgi:hypothetical protein